MGHYDCVIKLLIIVLFSLFLQHPIKDGEDAIKAKFAKLHDDMQEAFRKLDE